MSNPLQPSGGDLTDVEIGGDGRVTNSRSDGAESIGSATGVTAWQRSAAIATQSFLKRKRRQWPTPRI